MRHADIGRKGSHTSKGLAFGLSTGGVTFVLITIFHIVTGIQEITKSQNVVPFNDAGARIILTDSATGKKDTVRLLDYLENKNRLIDTIAKTKVIFPR